MAVACWSLKGGCGTTAVATALAVLAARRRREGALLVDLAGDVPSVLGLHEPIGPGVAEWLLTASASEAAGRAWGAREVDVGHGLAIVPRGRGPLRHLQAGELLARMLAADPRRVVVDCGALGADSLQGELANVGHVLVRRVDTSLLVTRACALALRRLATTPLPVSGVVVLREPGRSLLVREIEHAAGAPVVAEVPYDLGVARALDAGQLALRLPLALNEALQPL